MQPVPRRIQDPQGVQLQLRINLCQVPGLVHNLSMRVGRTMG